MTQPTTPATPAGPALPAGPSLRHRLRAGIGWNLVGAVASQGVTFGVNLVVANVLGREVFGEFRLLQTTYVAGTLLAAFAMGTVTTKYVAESALTDPGRAGRILGACELFALAMGLLAAVALTLGAGPVAREVLQAPQLAGPLVMVAWAVMLGAFNSYLTGALAGLERFRALATANLLSGALYLALCGPMAAWAGLHGSVGALLGYSAVQAVLLRWMVARQVRARGLHVHRGDWGAVGQVAKLALPFALANLTLWPAQWLGQTFLARTEDGLAELGLYAAADNFRMFVVFLPFVVTNFHWSILNQQKGLNDARRFRKVFWFNTALNGGLVVVGALTIWLLGPWLLRLFGREFAGGQAILALLLLATLPEAMGIAFSLGPLVQGRIWLYLAVMVLPRDAVRVVLAWQLCPRYGAAGLAIAYGAGWALALLTSLVLVAALGLHPSGRSRTERETVESRE